MSNTNYIAIVEKLVRDGKHGSYAVASHPELGQITFSLKPEVWSEKDWPERGTYVLLADVRKKRAGWRAMSGRFVRPSDNQHSSNESR